MPVASANAVCAVSGHFDTRTAATEIAHRLFDELGERCDLITLFASYHHRAAMKEAAETLRTTVNAGVVLGTTAESVLGGEHELEGLAGMAALGMTVPGIRISPWALDTEHPVDLQNPEAVRERLAIGDDTQVAIMLADPFTTPTNDVLAAVASVGPAERPLRIVGGMASGASQPGHNVLVLDDHCTAAGAVGVTIGGDVEVDCIVSQGAHPIGESFVVTKTTQNVILELGGKRALDVLQELAQGLNEHERQLLTKGLLLGAVIDEYKTHHGRGDFVVHNIGGFDQRVGGVAVMATLQVGQKVQFHVRDAATAEEDLQLLLDAQQLADPPLAGLLFTCNGRGTRLFQQPDHDINAVRARLGDVPVAGFFAAGEIGPVGGRSFVHGHTASIAVFRGKGAGSS